MADRIVSPDGIEVVYLDPGERVCPTCDGLGRWESCWDCGNRGYLFPEDDDGEG